MLWNVFAGRATLGSVTHQGARFSVVVVCCTAELQELPEVSFRHTKGLVKYAQEEGGETLSQEQGVP